MASRELNTLDPASLDRFRIELADAGFESTDGGRTWRGPIAPPLAPLTESTSMTIHVLHGWPFVEPQLQVEGLSSLEHASRQDIVCLWERGDGSRQWTTLAGWHQRIEEWVRRQRNGFRRRDTTMDAHRYFTSQDDRLAQFELESLRGALVDGSRGALHCRWRNEGLLEMRTDRAAGRELKGRWFYRTSIPAPPRNLHEFASLLTEEQRRSYTQLVATAGSGKRRKVATLLWGQEGRLNALVLVIGRQEARAGQGTLAATALELAPADQEFLLTRAGPEAARLAEYSVIVFGAGAVGSHLALLLSESGIGALAVVDGERLRPSNVVRHAAPAHMAGLYKADAVQQIVSQHAPWTTVSSVVESPWNPVASQISGEFARA